MSLFLHVPTSIKKNILRLFSHTLFWLVVGTLLDRPHLPARPVLKSNLLNNLKDFGWRVVNVVKVACYYVPMK